MLSKHHSKHHLSVFVILAQWQMIQLQRYAPRIRKLSCKLKPQCRATPMHGGILSWSHLELFT